MSRQCPTCAELVLSREHLMCRACWRKVPAALQRQLMIAWAKCRARYIDHAKWKPYYKAREAAIAAVRSLGGGR